MRFRLPYKHDELPVDENSQRPTDNEVSTEKGAEPRPEELGTTDDSESDIVNKDFQRGVQAAQAMTQVWPFSHIATAYVL